MFDGNGVPRGFAVRSHLRRRRCGGRTARPGHQRRIPGHPRTSLSPEALRPDSQVGAGISHRCRRRRGSVVGFVAGSDSVARLYREFILKDGVWQGDILTPPRAVDPSSHRDLALRDHGRIRRAPRYRDRTAVPGRRRVGSEARGALLVDSFRRSCRRGLVTARVVVGAANDTAIRLYAREGSPKRSVWSYTQERIRCSCGPT